MGLRARCLARHGKGVCREGAVSGKVLLVDVVWNIEQDILFGELAFEPLESLVDLVVRTQ